MFQLWKETLLAGTQVDAKSKRAFTITPADVTDAERNINRMVRKGRKIPLVYEHLNVEECDPEEWKANYARNTFGWAGGARLSTTADVRKGIASRPGTLLVRHDVHDKRDVAQLKRTGYVSPKIYRGYLDSQGERYTGVTVAHVAASPTVCQWWQAPFAHELSDSDALYLAYTPPEKKFPAPRKAPSRPAYGESFTDWLDGLDLSALDTPEGNAVADEADDTDAGGDDDKGGDLKALIKAIRDAYGAKISDKVGNWKELIIAIESNGGDADTSMDDAPAGDADVTSAADAATTGAGGPPMVMSTLDRDPKRQTRAAKLAQPERDDAAKELKALFEKGMLTPTEFRLLDRQNKSFEMSFTADLEPAGKWLKVAKKLEEVRARKTPVWSRSGERDAPAGLNLSTVEVPEPVAARAAGVTEAAADMEALSKRLSPVK